MAVVVPTVILLIGPVRPDNIAAGWQVLAAVAGVALAGLGLTLMVWTVGLFARVGDGTLAPFDPPRNLVIRGPYRHVRNPMISGGLFVLLGESAGLLSLALLGWFVVSCLVSFTSIPLLEEPGLKRRFGNDYLEYRRQVPRWVPRVQGWPPPA